MWNTKYNIEPQKWLAAVNWTLIFHHLSLLLHQFFSCLHTKDDYCLGSSSWFITQNINLNNDNIFENYYSQQRHAQNQNHYFWLQYKLRKLPSTGSTARRFRGLWGTYWVVNFPSVKFPFSRAQLKNTRNLIQILCKFIVLSVETNLIKIPRQSQMKNSRGVLTEKIRTLRISTKTMLVNNLRLV